MNKLKQSRLIGSGRIDSEYYSAFKSHKCLLCNTKTTKKLVFFLGVFNDDLRSKSTLFKCASCGSIYTYPFLKERDLKNFYNSYGPHTHDNIIKKRAIFKLHDVLQKYVLGVCLNVKDYRLKKLITSIPIPFTLQTFPLSTSKGAGTIKVLDIGCGGGHFLELAKNLGCETYGTEVNDNLVRQLNKRGIRAYQNLSVLSRSHRKFDIIRINHVLEHLANPNLVLEQIRKMADRNTELIIGLPSFETPANLFKEKMFMHLPRHRIYFSKKGVRYLLKNNGFRIKLIRTRSGGVFSRSLLRAVKLPKILQTVTKIIDIFLLSPFFDFLNVGDSYEIYAYKKN